MINIMDKIRELIAKLYDDKTKITEATTPEDLGLDEIDMTELEIELEEAIDFRLPTEKELAWNTFGELKKLIEAALK